jgi:hypothetical protein
MKYRPTVVNKLTQEKIKFDISVDLFDLAMQYAILWAWRWNQAYDVDYGTENPDPPPIIWEAHVEEVDL